VHVALFLSHGDVYLVILYASKSLVTIFFQRFYYVQHRHSIVNKTFTALSVDPEFDCYLQYFLAFGDIFIFVMRVIDVVIQRVQFG